MILASIVPTGRCSFDTFSLGPLAKEAEICLTQPITSSIAEGSFRALKRLPSSDRQALGEGTLHGCLSAMINGDICHRWPNLAQSDKTPRTTKVFLDT